MAGKLGCWVLGNCDASDAARQLHLDLIQHLVEWHCSRAVGAIAEENLLRFGHSVRTLTCCRTMFARLEDLFEWPHFNLWLEQHTRVTRDRASLLQSVCLSSLGGDIRVIGLLRHLHARSDFTLRRRTVLAGCDLLYSLHNSYLPDKRACANDCQEMGLALGPYGWYSAAWMTGKYYNHPLGTRCYKINASSVIIDCFKDDAIHIDWKGWSGGAFTYQQSKLP